MDELDCDALIEALEKTVPILSDDLNFWMIRTKGGAFYHEFLESKFIAIGWNALSTSDFEADYDRQALIEKIKVCHYPDEKPAYAVSKCERFVLELKENDIGIVVGKQDIAFVKIGEYYEKTDAEYSPVKELEIHAQIKDNTYVGGQCPYKKCRKIEVISTTTLDAVSQPVYKAIVSNHHSLSCLNDYAVSLLGTCYDLAYYKKQLIIRYRITQPRDINPIDFSSYVFSVSSLLSYDQSVAVSGKYNVNSSGEVILQLCNSLASAEVFIRSHLLPWVLIQISLFGGKFGSIEVPSAISLLPDLYIKYAECKYELRIKKASAEKAEAEVETIKLSNEEKRLEIEQKKTAIVEAEGHIEMITNSASGLQIQPPNTTVPDDLESSHSGDSI